MNVYYHHLTISKKYLEVLANAIRQEENYTYKWKGRSKNIIIIIIRITYALRKINRDN